jgi:hypothetical protein
MGGTGGFPRNFLYYTFSIILAIGILWGGAPSRESRVSSVRI